MPITKNDIIHVADLARIEIDEVSLDKLTEQIGRILEYVDTLNQAETNSIQKTSHAITLTNAFREDITREYLTNDQALSNAPEKENGAFVVPKVVER
ncbi:MAG: Asp-tRNA(Asn)/Glu-tRNA(Gln) amidotransferase subunit GatC [Desulfobacteraceae bacterium]|nr:MAG: Asp-tRNA(Asn)/Glu-tRNA(Gln) amidotransferase subunit GatC [Desulfobacteraceae bacterium]